MTGRFDPTRLLALLVLTSAPVACDNTARNEQIAAVEKKPAEDDAKLVAERKEKRLAAERAKAEAADKLRAEIAKIAVATDKPKIGLAEGCEAAAEAQDRFVARIGSEAAKTEWAASRENSKPMSIIECTSADSVDVATCQTNALDNAPPALAENMKDILDYCVEKFAKPKPAGTPPAGGGEIPKRPQ
jgi:hypothetical protein